ncbi:MAG: POTRA domain-containing protein, partial [Calditrichota bacterium]
FQNDLDNIVRFYQQQGFLGAKVTGYQVNRDTSRHEVHIAINVHEGPRSYVKAISLTDNHFFSGEKLGKQITLKQDDPLLQKKIVKSTNNILNLYSDNGFLDAQIQTDVTLMADSQQAFVDFTIHEGPQYKIGGIEITGLNFTRPHVVNRELTFKKGQIVNYSRLLNSQRQLYLTGLFRSVFISLNPPEAPDSTLRTVLIDIREKAPAQFNVSGGYGSVEKFRVRSEVYYDNLWGTARKAGIAAKYSSLYLGAEASFTEPWTFHTRFRTDLNLFADYLKEPGYNLRSIGALLTVGRKFMQRSNVLISYRHENNYLSNIKVTEIPQRPE